MTDRKIRTACLELMATAPAVYLSAVDADGYPRVRAMLNLRNRAQYPDHVHLYEGHDEDFLVYLATNTASRKRRDIERDRRICLYYCHPESFFGLSLVGDVQIVEERAVKEVVWAEGWERYYPTTGDPSDPDYTLLRLLPSNAAGWAGSGTFSFDIGR